mgnify:CR=1 FL=1
MIGGERGEVRLQRVAGTAVARGHRHRGWRGRLGFSARYSASCQGCGFRSVYLSTLDPRGRGGNAGAGWVYCRFEASHAKLASANAPVMVLIEESVARTESRKLRCWPLVALRPSLVRSACCWKFPPAFAGAYPAIFKARMVLTAPAGTCDCGQPGGGRGR